MSPRIPLLLLATVAMASPLRADHPLSYDLRNVDGLSYVPAIQNQGEMEDCWTFATATSLNSNLQWNGQLGAASTPPPVTISSWHLSAFNGQPQVTAYISGDGPNDEWGQWGGFYWQSMSYLTRGSGSWAIPGAATGEIPNMGGGPVSVTGPAVADNAFPLAAVNNYDDMADYLPPLDQPTTFRVTAVHFYNQDGSGRSDAEQIAKVKQAILDHGAVATYMYAGGYTLNNHKYDVFHKESGVMYEYLPTDSTEWLDHAVTIIGWDDSIQVPGAPNQGAWIVQNSWGTDWGGTLANHDGTFYAAYDDKYIGRYVTSFQGKSTEDTSSVVLQNELGPLYQTSSDNLADNGFGKIDADRAVSLLDAHGMVSLSEVGLYSFVAGAAVTISIYETWSASLGPTDSLYTDSFVFSEIGYTSFVLDEEISLSGLSTLIIEIDYADGDIPYVMWGSGNTGDTVASGLSYYYDTASGEWVDFASLSGSDMPGVFFVKGIATVPEPGTVFLIVGSGLVLALRRRRRADR